MVTLICEALQHELRSTEGCKLNVTVVHPGAVVTNFGRNAAAATNATIDDPAGVVIVGACVGDINGDDVVDGVDLAFILGAWASDDSDADLDGDGMVDGVDLAIVLGAWGSCSE